MPFFSLPQLPETEFLPGFRGRMVHAERMTLAFWQIEAGAALPLHQHPHEQVAQVLEGRFELTMQGETRVLTPGEVAVIPPETPHQGRALSACRILDIFQPVREIYRP
jgi:quercetin dioxygenase-like cupin family protein